MSEVDDHIARWLGLVGPGNEKDCRVGLDKQPIWYELRLDEAYRILQSVQQRRWIPVEERLPEKTGRCLGFTADGETVVALRIAEEPLSYWVVPVDSDDKLTHWMPLPDPPEVPE